MTINEIQVGFEKGDYTSILAGVIAPERPTKMENIWFRLNNLNLKEGISLNFFWYMTIS